YPALASFDDVEIVAICDLDPQRLHTTADRYNISRRYTDYRRMIEETAPDAVYAIGQPHIMYDIWRWCLEQGLNVYIEKPFGITLHQAESLAYLAEKHGCITQVSFQRRACPMVVMLREACLARGPITHAVCRFYKWEIRPYLEARDRLTDDGIHAVDTLRWMCGGEVTAVHSVSRRILTPDRNFFAAPIVIGAAFLVAIGATGLLLLNGRMSPLGALVALTLSALGSHGMNALLMTSLPLRLGRGGNVSSAAGALDFTSYVGGGLSGALAGYLLDGLGWPAVFGLWLVATFAILLSSSRRISHILDKTT
ncbi:MAG: Gfo/Idh/MocA family oxidoreductase, partial [Chloroflexi bacterium]|nr:Gfo/Idh/MocA family oxidoreductase [Chloroflexota bacterium]